MVVIQEKSRHSGVDLEIVSVVRDFIQKEVAPVATRARGGRYPSVDLRAPAI